MVLNIGRLLKPIGTAIRTKIDQSEKERKFNQEYQEKLNEERRKAKLEGAADIAKAEQDRRLVLAKKGQSTQRQGMFEKVTGQPFFIGPGGSGSKKGKNNPSNMGMGSFGGGGISDADRAMLGMPPAKKSSEQHKKKKSRGKTIIIRT